MLAFFVGVLAEQRMVERGLEVLERREVGGYPVTLGSRDQKAVLVCRTGLAPGRSEGAARTVFSYYSPAAVVSARMATSVLDDVRPGDLVFCLKTHVCRGEVKDEASGAEADHRLLTLAEQAARRAGLRYSLGEGLTVDIPLAEPLDRERLLRRFPVSVVDTEGTGLAGAARERGLPFLSVRLALGRAFDPVPDSLELAGRRGALSPARTLVYCLRRPARAPALMRLAASVRRAALTLAAFTREFLREWSLEP